ncbi:SLAC1 anion channel family protein [Thiolinea disciformis]|uniref:SLAC1 anion channel family protein n=1 Tax=Thiolinea disciformis TaxID=125614 RepID=UPI00037C95FC|nr:SLAC1 anion channel family protein [Thiolinea disciformis]
METNHLSTARLAHFPIAFFAMVMGLSGLAIVWQKAQLLYHLTLRINVLILGLAVLVFSVLSVAYLVKLIHHRAMVLQEWQHPIKLSFFPTISISLLLLAVGFLELQPNIARVLWLVGATLHLGFTLAVVTMWMHQTHYQIPHLLPVWFIPAVGNVIVPLAGVPLGYLELSWFFFSIGLVFWSVLMTLAFYRLVFHPSIAPRLMPSLFILIAPPAVGFLAYVRLNHGELDNFARILFFAGLFITLLLLTQAKRFIILPFTLSAWAYSFPLAAMTTATLLMFEKTHIQGYSWLGVGLLILLTGIVSALLFKTLQAAWQGRICVPE